MKKDPLIFLKHILESIEQIEEYTKEISRDTFLQSQQIQDAVIRRLEIIGEASKNIPEEFRMQHPDIPWQKMSGMRDVLIHEYFGVDVPLTWGIVQKDLPSLKEKILKALSP